MVTANTFKNGALKSLEITWMLTKIVVPIYALVTILGHTPVIGWLSHAFAPLMRITGLPGEAAIALATSCLVSQYGAMGVLLAMKLDAYQMTTMALMINLAHELPVESAILKRTGITVWPVLLLRLFMAFAVGAAMHFGRLAFGG